MDRSATLGHFERVAWTSIAVVDRIEEVTNSYIFNRYNIYLYRVIEGMDDVIVSSRGD